MNESVFEDVNAQVSENQTPRARTRKKKKCCFLTRNPLMTAVVAVALVVLLVCGVVLGMKGCAPKPSIEGRWDLDGATVYEFHPEGKGALILTTMTFDFDYTIDGKQVKIDFQDDRATDVTYEFAVTDELLMLMGGPNETQSQHILKRQK